MTGRVPNVYHDDIDLLTLLGRAMTFIRNYRWLFLTSLCLGLILGLLRYKSMPDLYKSRLVLQSNLLANQNYIQIVTNWNALLKTGGHAELACILNMHVDTLRKIIDLKADEIQKIFTPNNPNGFTIDAKVTDPSVFDALENGLVYGFDNSGYIREKLVSKRLRLNQLVQKTAFEIQSLDSVKNQVSSIMKGRQSSSSLIVDASGISRQLIDLNEKYLNYKEELDFTSSVQVLQEFSQSKQKVSNRLAVWLILTTLPCIAIAYITALIHSVNRRLKQRVHSISKE